MYSPSLEGVAKRVEITKATIEIALGIKILGKPFFSSVQVMVWTDKRFNSDCGETLPLLKSLYRSEKRVRIAEHAHGDDFSSILNRAVSLQLGQGITHSFIWSSEAESYLNELNLEKMTIAFARKAKVTGLAIKELYDTVMDGQIANTAAAWENVELLAVGGFPMIAARKPNSEYTSKIKSFDNQGVLHYDFHGVEEILPLIHFVETFDQEVIAPIPTDSGIYSLEGLTEERVRQHYAKMMSKQDRKIMHAATVGCSLSYLKRGIMSINWEEYGY
ncbi:MAG: hypothetical protein H6765_11100 [Candidatus Peribacteria bacterium]|nr:MAG: hypothetical protein H6765_11100 [Candidatus Peribacteria bacterium]